MKKLVRIKRIANNVRKWTEELESNKKYNSDLTEMCGIASYELWKRLTRAKLDSIICYSNFGHAFIKCHNHIIDVTATQFHYKVKPYEKIEIRKYPQPDHEIWKNNESAKTKISIKRFFQCWPDNQIHPEIKYH